jgi:hypothetical protein
MAYQDRQGNDGKQQGQPAGGLTQPALTDTGQSIDQQRKSGGGRDLS